MRHAWLSDLTVWGSIGSEQIWRRVKTGNVTRLYLDARQATAQNLSFIKSQGVECGVVRDPSWNNLSAVDLARTLDTDLVRCGVGNSQCAVQVDIEYHDAAYVVAFLKEWRALRPSRVTSWTMEPNQGGWFTAELIAAIANDPNLMVIPQTYAGDMTPYGTADENRCNLIERGIARGRVPAYYDGAHLPSHWDGVAFTLERMPL